MAAFTKSAPDKRIACRGETWGRSLGHDVCLHEAEAWTFSRVTYRLFGIKVWHRDFDHAEMPMHEFISYCLGTGR